MKQNRHDPRDRLNQAFPKWMQPAITWFSGKALPGQKPLIGFSCTPNGKILVALLTVGLGLMIGIQYVAAVVA
jgi:hypothetical protein